MKKQSRANYYRAGLQRGRGDRDKLIQAYKWFNKPRTIRIKKWKIVIGAYILWTLVPHSAGHVVYADPITVPTKQPKIAVVKPIDAPKIKEIPKAALVATPSAAAYAAPTGSAKAFIYSHESGNRPSAVAPNGACGLGQALPCSKLPCSLSDYACQDAWFTGYMLSRYGIWEKAMADWISRAHWNGYDWVGGWW